MPSALAQMRGLVGRALTNIQAFADDSSNDRGVRLDRYGSLLIPQTDSSLYSQAEEGSMVIATNPTPGTGYTWVAAVTSYTNTQPLIVVYNNEPAGGKNIELRYLKLITLAAGTGAVAWQYLGLLDVQQLQTTAHHAAATLVNPNFAYPVLVNNLQVLVQTGSTASVFPAPTAAARMVNRGSLGGLNVPGDVMRINFGSLDSGTTSGITAAEGATQAGVGRADSDSPVVIPPGGAWYLYFWSASSSAAINPEMIFGMVCR